MDRRMFLVASRNSFPQLIERLPVPEEANFTARFFVVPDIEHAQKQIADRFLQHHQS